MKAVRLPPIGGRIPSDPPRRPPPLSIGGRLPGVELPPLPSVRADSKRDLIASLAALAPDDSKRDLSAAGRDDGGDGDRGLSLRLVTHPMFDRVILVLIFLNCLLLAAASPLGEDGASPWGDAWLLRTAEVAEYFFTAAFAAEAALKVHAFGVRAYLRSPWNRLDAFIVLTSLATLASSTTNVSALRTFRALRPLRTVSRMPVLRLLINAILGSIPRLGQALSLGAFLFCVFGVGGLYAFGGRFSYRCVGGPALPSEADRLCGARSCPPPSVCRAGHENPNEGMASFDNIALAFLAVFQTVSMEDFTVLQAHARDAVGDWTVAYFTLVVVLGAFLWRSLFVATVMGKFEETVAEMKREEGAGLFGGAAADANAAAVAAPAGAAAAAAAAPAPPPASSLALDIVEHPYFDRFFMSLILLNTALMASEHHGQPDYWAVTLNVSHLVLTTAFAVELCLKLAGLGARRFARDRFNLFDAAIVLVSVAEVAAAAATGTLSVAADQDNSHVGALQALRVLRLARVLRVVRIVRYAPALKRVVAVIGQSLGPLGWVMCLLLLFVFIFAVVGMQLFGAADESWRDPDAPARFNFHSFPQAMLYMFVLLTSEGWPVLMADTVLWTSKWAAIFYVLWIVVASFVLLELVLVVILNNFAEGDGRDEETAAAAAAATAEAAANARRSRRSSLGGVAGAGGAAGAGAAAADAADAAAASPPQPEHMSCGCFSDTNPVRLLAARAVAHPLFDRFVMLVILINSVAMAAEGPGERSDSSPYYYIDVAVITVFTLECAMRILVFGFVVADDAYLRDPWNRLDFFVVVTSLLAHTGEPSIAFCALFRALRPLRIVSQVSSMRVATTALVRSTAAISSVAAMCAVVMLMFGILGVSLWAGQFYACSDPTVAGRAACAGVAADGAPRVWANAARTFDSSPAALVSLFQITTLDGWIEVAESAAAARGVDVQPAENTMRDPGTAWAYLYFVAFIALQSFFFVQLFVGVVYYHFVRAKRQETGSALLTAEQDAWVRAQRRLILETAAVRYAEPDAPWRRAAYRAVTHKAFDRAVVTAIVVNTVFLMTYHHGQPDSYTTLLDAVNVFFAALFAAEACARVAAIGVRAYLRDNWNKFDLLLVVVAAADVALVWLVGVRVLAVARSARVVRLVKVSRGLSRLFANLMYALPSLANIAFLLFLVLFIFSVLCMDLYGGINYNEPGYETLNDHVNFATFFNAINAMFRLCTGDNWSGLLADTSRDCDACSNPNADTAPLLLLGFVLLNFLFLNLFVSVILESFYDVANFGTDEVVITQADVDRFGERWALYDANCTGTVRADVLPRLLLGTRRPLGFDDAGEVRAAVRELDIPVRRDGTIEFKATLLGLIKRLIGTELPAGLEEVQSVSKLIGKGCVRRAEDVVRQEWEQQQHAEGADEEAVASTLGSVSGAGRPVSPLDRARRRKHIRRVSHQLNFPDDRGPATPRRSVTMQSQSARGARVAPAWTSLFDDPYAPPPPVHALEESYYRPHEVYLVIRIQTAWRRHHRRSCGALSAMTPEQRMRDIVQALRFDNYLRDFI